MLCSPAGFQWVHDRRELRRSIFCSSSHIGQDKNHLSSLPWRGLKSRHKRNRGIGNTSSDKSECKSYMLLTPSTWDPHPGHPPKAQWETGLEEQDMRGEIPGKQSDTVNELSALGQNERKGNPEDAASFHGSSYAMFPCKDLCLWGLG